MKTHPTPEEWMSFLYGEDSPARHTQLGAHLQGCAECRQQVQTWRGSMSALDAWAVPPSKRRSVLAAPAVRWAAAALVVLGLVVGFGRMNASAKADMARLTAALRAEMETKLASARDEFAQTLNQQRVELAEAVHAAAIDAAGEETEQLFARLAKIINDRRDADQRAYLAALKEVEERYDALRHDLDTVAVNADDGLSQARAQLIELAELAQAPAH